MIFKVLVVDDFKPFRQFIFSALRERPEFQIADASDGLEALREIEKLQPDLVLLDVSLPNLNGIEVAKRVTKLAPAAKILFLSQECSPELVQEALNVGAQGYVHKLRALPDLLLAIDAVLRGERFLSSGLSPLSATLGQQRSSEPVEKAKPYGWQQTVPDALESTSALLRGRVNIAERAIAARLRNSNEPDMEERLALKRALRSLAILIAETKPQPESNEEEEIA